MTEIQYFNCEIRPGYLDKPSYFSVHTSVRNDDIQHRQYIYDFIKEKYIDFKDNATCSRTRFYDLLNRGKAVAYSEDYGHNQPYTVYSISCPIYHNNPADVEKVKSFCSKFGFYY